MADEFLGDRKKALEESFFAKENARLLEKMKAEKQKLADVEALAEISQLPDQALLERLVELHIGPDTWAALSLVPLVEVAWADGDVQRNERAAILAAAADQGIAKGTPSYDLLEGWLDTRPGPELLAAWGEYAVELAAALSAPERAALRAEIIDRARRVADAAGGILGFGKTSEAEKAVLAELEKPFS